MSVIQRDVQIQIRRKSMKKTFLIVVVALGCILSACGDASKSNDGSGTQNVEKDTNERIVTEGQASIELNGDFSSIKESLGETLDYTESKSCLYDGYDKTYTYENVVIITYPIDNQEKVSSITILSEDVKHNLPVSIGDNVDAIKDAYGESNLDITDACCIYEDEFGIAFYTLDGVVVEIEIYIL